MPRFQTPVALAPQAVGLYNGSPGHLHPSVPFCSCFLIFKTSRAVSRVQSDDRWKWWHPSGSEGW